MFVYLMWNQKHFIKALMRNVLFSFLHQKTYIVGKKENIYGMQNATGILLHIHRIF